MIQLEERERSRKLKQFHTGYNFNRKDLSLPLLINFPLTTNLNPKAFLIFSEPGFYGF